MNPLPLKTRIAILDMPVEGSSMRSISRITGVSISTVTKLLEDAGKAGAAYHDATVRNVKARNVQCDEIWSFCYTREKNVAAARAAPNGAGDVWTWTATARDFMDDPAVRLASRVQLSTEGHKAYLDAVEGAFGMDVDYAMLVKLYGDATRHKGHEKKYSPAECTGARKELISGSPVGELVGTSHVER